jgi:TRAP-type C4-dicarboxylate transport system substrate-binding protein
MSTVKKPVRKIEDFKGLKIHNPQGAAKYFFLKSLGISSQLVPQTELVMALSTGMVDGEYGNVESLLANGYPAKYVHEWGTLMSGDSGASMLMNLAFWNSLPPDIKKIVEKVASKTEAWTITELFKAEAKARAKLKSRGVEFINLSPEMQEQVRARAAKPVLDWYIKRYPESASIILDEVARLDPRRKK